MAGAATTRQGPRIYNLFPLLAGDVAGWRHHLARIAAMGFDWVYLNPFHEAGFSGSLYAVKDYHRLNPLFRGEATASDDELLSGFIADAAEHGLAVMMDLVINHTAKDSVVAAGHPEWFAHNPDGTLRSPRAVDDSQPDGMVEWGDLAEIDWDQGGAPLVDFCRDVALHYARLGFRGFRCDAAYQVPPPVWESIIGAVKAEFPDILFAAETLGCTPDQAVAVGRAGFAYLFNSSKWWDFRDDWFYEQYDRFRAIAPSIAFPESHDTPRLGEEVPAGDDPQLYYRRRLLFALFASAGWMMPMGFEFGFRRRLDVVLTRAEHWEEPAFDLSPLITRLNAAKAATPALNQEGRLERLSGPDDPVLVLRRWTLDESEQVVLLLNLSDGEQLVELDQPMEDIAPAAARPALQPGETRLRHPVATTRALPRTISRPIIIADIRPSIDGGRYAVKREVGDMVEVSADIFKDGHDRLAARLLYREDSASQWDQAPLTAGDDDRWLGRFLLTRNTRYVFTLEAWVDAFESWRDAGLKKRQAGQTLSLELTEGRRLVEEALLRADDSERPRLTRVLAELDHARDDGERTALLLSGLLRRSMAFCPDRRHAVRADRDYGVIADRPAARFAAWYEMVPRSQGTDPTRSATFAEAATRLPEIAAMGFDVVYLVPIHPIGRIHRKGPDNSLTPGPDDPGSPYAIGADEGGHKAVHPALGGMEGFRGFVEAASANGLEVALDLAIQCAPDHPWVRDHPQWFRFRPDGTIQYAENPPKRYQDIVNVDFWCADARALWEEILSTVLFWVAQGVTIFRVDNPHTKPVPFWEWLIGEVQRRHPEVLFLAEAFTRPKMMRMLAKVGFSQSYTYFTWRNFKDELTAYIGDLTRTEMREYYRPHFFPSTPDILPPYLQTGGRPAFRIRLVLAATLSSLYGIYNGYELCENAAVPNSEEYLHSEKYQYKTRDWNQPGHIKDDITLLNTIRRENPALQEFENIVFHQADDDSVLFYGKSTRDRTNIIFVAVNLDPFDTREADLHFPLAEMGLPEGETFEVEELLGGARHLWRGPVHRVRLDPQINPAAIYRVTVWQSVPWREPCG